MTRWIEGFKVGDKVITGKGAWVQIGTVKQITYTELVITHERCFKCVDDSELHVYNSHRLEKWSQEAEDELIKTDSEIHFQEMKRAQEKFGEE